MQDNANVSHSQTAASPAEMNFFDFENQPTESFSAEKEVTDYLRSGYEFEILNQFQKPQKVVHAIQHSNSIQFTSGMVVQFRWIGAFPEKEQTV